MSVTRNFLTALAFSTALSTASFAQEASLDTVVATVGETEITVGHMIAVKQQLPEQYRTIPNERLFTGILEQLVQQTLLANSITTDPSWMVIATENNRRNALSNHAIDQTRSAAVSEDTLRAAYAAQYAGTASGNEWDASHILVEEEAQALALIEQINAGADFAELAKKHSTGPSGPRGGALGWFGAGQMVPEFELAVKDLETGGVSEPVRTQFGWHIVKLNDTRPIMPPSLDDVRAELEGSLRDAAVEAKVAQLTADTDIQRNDVDPSVLSTLSFD